MRLGFSALLGVILIGLTAPPAEATPPPPGEYSYSAALSAGLVNTSDFTQSVGEPLCGPLPTVIPSAPDVIPDDAPTCYRPPEQQGLFVLVLPAGDPGFGSSFDPTVGLYRHIGSRTNNRYQGGSMMSEVRDPSVDHCTGGPCVSPIHFYSRVQGITPANNLMEVGWVEMNHPFVPPSQNCANVNDQIVMTNRQFDYPNGTPMPICYTAYNLALGSEQAFRVRQYGARGDYKVTFQIYVGGSWEELLPRWSGVRCWNPPGDPYGENNCQFGFAHEVYDSTERWFPLNDTNGDGLMMRNIKIRTGESSWPLFDWNLFGGTFLFNVSPYTLCPKNWYFKFTAFYISPAPCN